MTQKRKTRRKRQEPTVRHTPKYSVVRAFLRNEKDSSYRIVEVDAMTLLLLSPLDGWTPYPEDQIRKGPNGCIFVEHAGADMTGWQLRLNRLAQDRRLTEVSAAMGGKTSSLAFHHEQCALLAAKHRAPVYELLGIDHRPATPTPQLLRNTCKYLRCPPEALADMLGLPASVVLSVYQYGTPPTDEFKHRWYQLYCMLPDLTREFNPYPQLLRKKAKR